MVSHSLEQMGKSAKAAAKILAKASDHQRNSGLKEIVIALKSPDEKIKILEANLKDLQEAESKGLSASWLDRLSLQNRLDSLCQDLEQIINLPSPIGEVIDSKELPNGLQIERVRVPLGVIGVIYEARPNVTLDVAALCIKTSNCAILRGGSETLRTNRALVALIRDALKKAGLPAEAIQFIDSPDRSLVTELLHLHNHVDLIIPRGGASLHQFCKQESRIPVITGGIGICHLYADSELDITSAIEVIYNAKTQRPTVCNALDTLIVHTSIGAGLLDPLSERLQAAGVKLKVDREIFSLLEKKWGSRLREFAEIAQEADWDQEWLGLTLGIRLVNTLDEAIAHIQAHSSGHSDGILTDHSENAEIFLNEIDSAAVYHNASTRFTDGGQLGLGAEIAISTQKVHARGPMGLSELTSYKWVIRGNYHVRRG